MKRHSWVFVVMALIASLAGCSRHPLDQWWPEPNGLTHDLPMYAPLVGPPPKKAQAFVGAFKEPTGSLALQNAMAMALIQNPDLAGFTWEVRAAEARALQASLPPNPEVGVEVENIGGTGALSGIDGTETTFSLRQVFLLDGKLGKRTKVAALERDLASWDYETKRIEVLVGVTQRFVDVLAAQRRVVLAKEARSLAAHVHDAVSKRVDAGGASPTEKIRTGVLVSTSRIALQRAERALLAARHRLAGTWGSTTPAFETATGRLEEVAQIPTAQALTRLVSQNPQIARWAVEMSQRQAAIDLAKSQGVPDVEVGAGWRYLNETDDKVFVAEFSLPLPIFDRNQGGVLEARYNLAKAEQERRSAEVRVKTTLAAAYQELTAAHGEATALKGEVLPAARQGFDAVEKAYRQGKVGYLEVLDTQRTLIDVQAQYIDALAAYHRGVAEIEGLIGQPLSEVTINSTPQSKVNNP